MSADRVGIGEHRAAGPTVAQTGVLVRVLHLAAFGIALVVLVVAPLVSAVWEGGLPITSVVGYDFGAYYHGAQSIRDGVSPFFRETVAGPFPLKVSWYLYPPPFAVAIVPFSFLPAPAANLLWVALLAAGLLVTAAMIAGAGDLRRAEPPIAIVTALALGLSVPGVSGIGQGAVTSLLGLLGLAPLLLGATDRIAGLTTAAGALAKIQPGMWAAYLLGAGRMRAVLVAGGVTLAVLILTFALPGVRAGWAEYPTVLANAAASDRAIVGNGGVGALLGLCPSSSHLVETAFLLLGAVLLFVAGRGGVRFAPLAMVVGLLSTPTLWSHATFLVLPGALLVVAMGPGVMFRLGGRERPISAPRLAELLAVGCFILSYCCFLSGLDRFMVYVLVLPTAAAAARWGPIGRTR
jgi:hypothetical protein